MPLNNHRFICVFIAINKVICSDTTSEWCTAPVLRFMLRSIKQVRVYWLICGVIIVGCLFSRFRWWKEIDDSHKAAKGTSWLTLAKVTFSFLISFKEYLQNYYFFFAKTSCRFIIFKKMQKCIAYYECFFLEFIARLVILGGWIQTALKAFSISWATTSSS